MFRTMFALFVALTLAPVPAFAGGLSRGIESGLLLRDYIDNNAQRQEESRRRTELYNSQAKQLDAQTQLLQQQLQQMQQQSRCNPTTNPDCYVCCNWGGECKTFCSK